MLKKVFLGILVLALLLVPIQAQFTNSTIVTSDIEFTNGKWFVKSFMSDGKVLRHSVDKLMRGSVGPQGQCADCQTYNYITPGFCFGAVYTTITLGDTSPPVESPGECWLDETQDPPTCLPAGQPCKISKSVLFTNSGSNPSEVYGHFPNGLPFLWFRIEPGNSNGFDIGIMGCGNSASHTVTILDFDGTGNTIGSCIFTVTVGCNQCVD